MTRIEKLEWICRRVHKWDDRFRFVCVCFSYPNEPVGVNWANESICGIDQFTHQEWLSMREKLQNKPKFADHPDAKCFVQNADGQWFKSDTDSEIYPIDDSGFWRMTGYGYWTAINEGIVLGDWRDTLEKRTELETKTGQNEMTITTQDNSWHERGGLPPVGTVCEAKYTDFAMANIDRLMLELISNANQSSWFQIKVVSAAEDDVFFVASGYPRALNVKALEFRPLRTEREKAIDEMADAVKSSGKYSNYTICDDVIKVISERLYDAGYRKEQNK